MNLPDVYVLVNALRPDASLAAVAIEHGCRLITFDRDFAQFDSLDRAPPS